ncbi:MAG: M3 family oligoendopeptidase [Planctomyces sp.]
MIPTFTPASDYVPAQIDALNWDALAPLFKGLLERELHCAKCIERLIIDRSELDATIAEAYTTLYVTMTCHTDDQEVKKKYFAFVENIEPRWKEASFELDKRIIASPFIKDLDQNRYRVLLRDMKTSVELFRTENLPLEAEHTKIQQKYQELNGAMMVTFRGQERTLQQMGVFQEDTDRATREEAWRLVAERRLKDRAEGDTIFDKLLDLRQRIARNAGCAGYRDFAFRQRRRYDYTVEDCNRFAQGVEQHIVPVLRRLNRERAKALGLPALRPWDLAVDIKGRAPLRPFATCDEMVERTSRIFHRMDRGLGELFDSMRHGGCLDLDSRKGKAPGGYQASRDRIRMPFIFMNAVGLQRDVETMVHEAGHAFHSLLSRQEQILSYRSDAPIEFCEVASMTMELTAHPFLDEFYSKPDADRARRVHLEQLATLLPWIATIDQFQHWLYTNVGHTQQQRTDAWLELRRRFGPEVDWSGTSGTLNLAEARAAEWQRQLHLFTSPFYYIEYGLAQLGALQLYSIYRTDPAKAITGYKSALALGGSRPLPDLFRAAGLDFDFSPERIRKTWSAVEEELASLPA